MTDRAYACVWVYALEDFLIHRANVNLDYLVREIWYEYSFNLVELVEFSDIKHNYITTVFHSWADMRLQWDVIPFFGGKVTEPVSVMDTCWPRWKPVFAIGWIFCLTRFKGKFGLISTTVCCLYRKNGCTLMDARGTKRRYCVRRHIRLLQISCRNQCVSMQSSGCNAVYILMLHRPEIFWTIRVFLAIL